MTPVRFLLNTAFSGANAFLALADRRGLFRDAGLDITFTPGRGAYGIAQRLVDEGFDAAYGDLSGLIELAAHSAADAAFAPIAVMAVHQGSPCAVTVARAGPIRCAADLAGATLVGHANDVALRTFAAFAQSAGLAPSSVNIKTDERGMAVLLQDMLAGKADGVFGYVTTHTAALAGVGLRAADCVRTLPYRDICPDLPGSGLMAACGFVAAQPQAVAGLVGAVRTAIAQAQAEPQAAIEAVLALNATADASIELERWIGTLRGDMACRSAVAADFGDLDPQRLDRSIALLTGAYGWPRTPVAGQILTRRFL